VEATRHNPNRGIMRQLVKCGGVVPTFIVELRFCRQLDEIPDRVVKGFVGRPMNDACT
jgi:hypothetical protein